MNIGLQFGIVDFTVTIPQELECEFFKIDLKEFFKSCRNANGVQFPVHFASGVDDLFAKLDSTHFHLFRLHMRKNNSHVFIAGHGRQLNPQPFSVNEVVLIDAEDNEHHISLLSFQYDDPIFDAFLHQAFDEAEYQGI